MGEDSPVFSVLPICLLVTERQLNALSGGQDNLIILFPVLYPKVPFYVFNLFAIFYISIIGLKQKLT